MKTYKGFVSILVLFSVGLAACGPTVVGPSGPSPEEATAAFDAQVAAAVQTKNADATNLANVAAGGDAIPPADVQPTDTIAPDAPTNTPEPTATNTLEPTATFPADDPAVVLGNPDFQDAFNNANNWSEYDSAGSKAEIKDGKFFYTKKTVQFGSHWTLSWPKIEDYYLQVTVETPANCSGFDRYGFIFRAPDPDQGLLFMVACNGQYRLGKWDGSDMTFMVNWIQSGAINAGPNQSNRIGVRVQGKTITVYVNGVELASIEDTSFVGDYRFGLLVGAADTEPFTVKFDDLAYWTLP